MFKNRYPIFLLSLLLTGSVFSIGQTQPKTSFTLDDGRGNPLVESQTYDHREGTVVKIKSPTKLLVQGNRVNGNRDERMFEIDLVGVSSKSNADKTKKFLKDRVVGKRVTIFGNPSNESSELSYSGIILVDDEISFLNEYLIKKGFAAYSTFYSDNLVPYYWPCRLERAQATAKAARNGIWK